MIDDTGSLTDGIAKASQQMLMSYLEKMEQEQSSLSDTIDFNKVIELLTILQSFWLCVFIKSRSSPEQLIKIDNTLYP